MRPRLFEIGGQPFHSYGACMLLATFVFIAVMLPLLRQRNQGPAAAPILGVLMLLGYTVVAHVFWVALKREPSALPNMMSGFWGGQIGFALLAAGYLLVTRRPWRATCDALAVAWAAATVVHKLGCFLSGCCNGCETSVPWAMTFPSAGQCSLPDRPIHPTQLYDMASALAIGLALFVAYRRRAQAGLLVWWWGLAYAISKFASEWTRGDARFEVAGPVTLAMAAEVVVAAACGVVLLRPELWGRMADWQARRTASTTPSPTP